MLAGAVKKSVEIATKWNVKEERTLAKTKLTSRNSDKVECKVGLIFRPHNHLPVEIATKWNVKELNRDTGRYPARRNSDKVECKGVQI